MFPQLQTPVIQDDVDVIIISDDEDDDHPSPPSSFTSSSVSTSSSTSSSSVPFSALLNAVSSVETSRSPALARLNLERTHRLLSEYEKDNATTRAHIEELLTVQTSLTNIQAVTGVLKDNLQKIESIRDEELKCPCCLNIMTHPYIVPTCGHTLCYTCLSGLLRATVRLTPRSPYKCPVCRSSFCSAPVQPPIFKAISNVVFLVVGAPDADDMTGETGEFDGYFS
ncbi:hypothetical protein BV25DRAFT_1912121 [Artomyces pyxidatus]|uniref:Uncharacterized protein n=1 Tax=Artomyces pyxidatus TaxID=48021 RepID=A0ACB8TGI9_9AGAM|nr:hypothetical protein BV25DRAFT_1912121 [Artomyces pyxidatus]